MRKIWLVALIAVLSFFARSAFPQSFTTLPYNVPYQYGGETYPWALQAQIDSNNSYVFYCKNTAGDPSVDFNSSTTFLLRFGGGYAWSQAGYCQLVYTENGGTSWGNITVNGYWYFGNSEISSFSQLRSHREVKYNGYSSGNLVNNYTNSNFGVSGINQGNILVSGSSFAGGPVFNTFRLPLPGGRNWRLNTQIGGSTTCGISGPDEYHTGSGYYSLDFGQYSQENGQESNIPIYAAAAGTINTDLSGWSSSYGWTVVIDHDGGYRTRYAHLANEPLVSSGSVTQGQQLGVMGTTGNSTGIHLHFQVYYNASSASTVSQLGVVRMEWKKLDEYTVGCHNHYLSTNTQ